MRRTVTAVLAGMLAFGLTTAAAPTASERPGAPAEPTHTFEMEPGDAETFVGQVPGGFYLGLAAVRDATGGAYPDCSSDTPGAFYCESALVSVSGGELDVDEEDGTVTYKSTLNFSLTPDTPAGDFDLRLYESDEDGTLGGEIAATQEFFFDQPNEKLTIRVKTSDEEPTKWYLVVIDYWAAVGNYTMDISVE